MPIPEYIRPTMTTIAPISAGKDVSNARQARLARLPALLQQRILVLDGAMGTLIQRHRFSEEDFRGSRFADHTHDVRGNSDLLSLTQPDAIREIHRAYLAAGADIVSTNSFTATRIAQADYGLSELAYEINEAAARLAREAADEAEAADGRPRFVAGSMGPTNRTGSLSPDVNDPAARNVSFEELVEAYDEAARGLIAGGADLLLIETIFDTLNAKAAIFAVAGVFDDLGFRIPLDRLRDDHRRLGSHAVRADARGVLDERPPRRPAAGRAELRPWAAAAPGARRGAVTARGRGRLVAPERRPAQRARRVRRDAGADGRPPSASGRAPACSTSPGRAAGPRRSTRRRSRPRWPGCRRGSSRSGASPPTCPASSRSRSRCPAG